MHGKILKVCGLGFVEVKVKERDSGEQKKPVDTENQHVLPQKDVKKTDAPKAPAYASLRFGIFTLIMAIIGIATSVDGIIELKAWNSDFQTFQKEMGKQLELEQKHLDVLEKSLKDVSTRQKKLDKELTYFRSVIIPILQDKQPTDPQWQLQRQLQKIHQWLEQAQIDLRWVGDSQGALSLLETANNTLKALNIPALQETQVAITSAMVIIAAIKPADQTALFEQLKVIADEVAMLPAPVVPKNIAVTTSASATTTLQRAWYFVKDAVVVRPTTTAKKVTMQCQRVKDTLYLDVKQMQWALLKNDNSVFHWSVNEAINTIEQNGSIIDLSHPKTQQCLQHLKALDGYNITAPVLPDLTPACHQLKQYMDTMSQDKSAPTPSITQDAAP